jgi:hypothetical protein
MGPTKGVGMSKLWNSPSQRKEYNVACDRAPHWGCASSMVVAQSPGGGDDPVAKSYPNCRWRVGGGGGGAPKISHGGSSDGSPVSGF